MLDPIPLTSPPLLSSKGKHRDMSSAPVTTDLAERLIAQQRRNAGAIRAKERAERSAASASPRDERQNSSAVAPPAALPPTSRDRSGGVPPPAAASSSSRPPHNQTVSPRKRPQKEALEAPTDEFSRRLRISESRTGPSGSPSGGARGESNPTRKLFNPNSEATPLRRAVDPEHAPSSDAVGSGYASRRSPKSAAVVAQQRLFDPRKDDPMRFSRPTASASSSKGSTADHASSASASSYAPSIASSDWTLRTSTTDDSSMNGEIKPDEVTTNAFSAQLKRLYRAITALEAKIINEDAAENREDVRVVLKGAADTVNEDRTERWKTIVSDHKRLAEMMRNLLEISLAPSVPASLRNIPRKYNIITRLWTYGFHKLLESLRRAACAVPRDGVAFEHLQDFIYYAYTFYTHILEERSLDEYESNWLEALGDLARYRMNVAAMANSIYLPPAGGISAGVVLGTPKPTNGDAMSATSSISHEMQVAAHAAARIDDSPVPSIGVAAARLLESEPEKERWRQIAREWYSSGTAATPGAGKLHHHLGLLSREREGEELRGVYHFTKSLIAVHSFSTSRESVLPIWSLQNQQRRMSPDSRATELFVLLHGMLFTNIQMDDFRPTLARFLERLELEGAEEREWTMMAVVNTAAVLEYGRPTGVIRRAGGVGGREGASGSAPQPQQRVRLASKKEEDVAMEVDEDVRPAPITAIQTSPAVTQATAAAGPPLAFTCALELTFSMLAYTLRRPMRKASPYARSTLNPYNTVLLTFLATLIRHPPTLALLERAIPWSTLATFLSLLPREALAQAQSLPAASLLTAGQAPLDEDWCVRGAEWVGRRVYERGFWKAPREARMELDILERTEKVGDMHADGIIEDEEEEGENAAMSETARRWVRLARAGVAIARAVGGLVKAPESREWRIEGPLKEKVRMWAEEDRLLREEEDRRRTRRRWEDDEDMDVDEGTDDVEEESEEDENDTAEIKALKARRRYLRSLQNGHAQPTPAPAPAPRARGGARKPATASGPSLKVAAGYTILVVDTNIMLSSLSAIESLVRSLRWTIVVPLPVVMELDGLSKHVATDGNTALARAASDAVSSLIALLRTHAAALKIQTSRGNYLPNLNVRTERVDVNGDEPGAWERNMDDLILRAAIWQDEHWVDRSAMLSGVGPMTETKGAEKVVLLSFDRNLRLKARARQLAAANERDLAGILAMGT